MLKLRQVNRLKQHFEDYLREFVYGSIDGAVTTFAVVAGATGASFDTKVLIVLGFANLIADGFSMSVGSYLSTKSEQELMAKRGQSIKDEPSPAINGISTFVAFVVVGFVPLIAYLADLVFNLGTQHLFLIASILTTIAFALIGYMKSKVTHAPLFRSVAETLILGVLAASFAYILGDILERLIT